MEIVFNRNPQQIELVKAMASKNKSEATQAQEAFAAFVAPVIQKVLDQMATSALIYRDLPYDENADPSIPLDLYRDIGEDYIRVWSQNMAGGLPTNITQGLSEFKFTTFGLDSAISFLKKYARQARLDVVAAGLKRMSQEILLKQETNAWAPLLYTLANASTKGKVHYINSTQTGGGAQFSVDDMSRLATLVKRLYSSWAGGTPTNVDAKGLTDIFVSPEITEDVRAFSYTAVTRVGVTNSAANPTKQLPEQTRQEIYDNAGLPSIFGVTIHELLELGINQRYNVLYSTFRGGGFDATAKELVLGIDATRAAFHRPVEIDENGGQVLVLPDDQYVMRQEKIGFYAKVNEGRVITDDRALVGIEVG